MYWAEYKHNECNYNEFVLKTMVIWRPFCFSPFKPLSSNLAAVKHTFLNSAYAKCTKKINMGPNTTKMLVHVTFIENRT